MKKILVKLIIIAITFIIGIASFLITGKANNVVEQAAEAVLHTQGVDVDLSADDKDCMEHSNGLEKMDKNP